VVDHPASESYFEIGLLWRACTEELAGGTFNLGRRSEIGNGNWVSRKSPYQYRIRLKTFLRGRGKDKKDTGWGARFAL